jgi:hypothetical protein
METQSSIHEKWIAGIIWVGLLAALVFSATQLLAIILAINISFGNFSDNDIPVEDYLTTLILGGGAILSFLAWWRFANLSENLLMAFATGDSPFATMLNFPLSYLMEREDKETEEPIDLRKADSSDVSKVILYLGLSWGLLIIGSTLIPLVARITG